jgi:hypothetical protein
VSKLAVTRTVLSTTPAKHESALWRCLTWDRVFLHRGLPVMGETGTILEYVPKNRTGYQWIGTLDVQPKLTVMKEGPVGPGPRETRIHVATTPLNNPALCPGLTPFPSNSTVAH